MPAPTPTDRLAPVVRAFTTCVDLDEALATMVREALAEVGVTKAVLTTITPEGLIPIASHGIDPEVVQAFTPIPLSTELPLSVAARSGESVWIASLTERDEQFPALTGHYVHDGAWAALPLRSGERIIGALGLVLDQPTPFTPAERSFLIHVAGVCAAALDDVHSPRNTTPPPDDDPVVDEAGLRYAVELGGIGIISGAGDTIIEANDAFLHLVGRTRADIERGSLLWSEVAPDAERGTDRARLSHPREQLILHSDGRHLAALVSTVLTDRERWRWSAFVVDLSERKSIEHRLRVSEQRHRSLVNATSSVVWTTSPTGLFVTPQPDWAAYTGHGWEVHQGAGWLDALHPDDRAATADIWADAVTREVPYETAYRLWHDATSGYRQVEAHAAPVTDDSGEIREWIGTIIDVHDQRTAEATAHALAAEAQARDAASRATERLARQLEAAQRIAQVGSWEWWIDETISWSKELYRIFGLPEDLELRGPADLDAHVHPDDRSLRAQALERVFDDRQPFRYEQRILRPEGEMRITVVSGEPMVGDDGGVVGLRGTVQDITEQRAAQAELDRTREELLRSELSRLHEHELVRAMQEVALPVALPEVPDVDLAASYVPAEGDVDVGGDWYDAFVLDDGRVVITVGDVSGHGVGAAAVMAQLRIGLRAYAFEGLDPSTVLSRLNQLLCRHDSDCFATAVVGFYDPADRRLRWSHAGHPPPVLFGDEPAALLEAAGCGGTVLGIWPDETYDAGSLVVPPGAGVLLYTDGLIERRGESIDRGLDRLRRALDDHEAGSRSLPSLLEHLASALLDEGGRDDTCQLALRCAPSSSR